MNEEIIEPVKTEPVKSEIEKPSDIEISNGAIVPKTNKELLVHAGHMLSGKMVPDRFKNALEVYAAICYVRSLGFPDSAIRQCAVIKGTPSIFGDLPLALAQRSGELIQFREYLIDEDYNEMCLKNKNLDAPFLASVCEIQRKGYSLEQFTYTVSDAIAAKQIKDIDKLKGDEIGKYMSSPWYKHVKKMMRFKARILALQSQFADSLNGISIGEDWGMSLENINEKDVSPLKELNEKLGLSDASVL